MTDLKNSSFLTPKAKPWLKVRNNQEGTPCINIPESPYLKRLGYGTGVEVKLIKRSPRLGEIRSPWAIKQVRKCQKVGVKKLNQQIKAEAAVLEKIKHVNIVGFRNLAKTVDDGRYFLAMEAGQFSLLDLIESRREKCEGPFPSSSILKMCKGMASALQYLHNEMKILHGDIKSPNILAKEDFSEVKLCDFGGAMQLRKDMVVKRNKSHYGTPLWTCAEVINDKPATDKADIFALGCVMFEMLTLDFPHMEMLPKESDYENIADFEIAFEEAEHLSDSSLGKRPHLSHGDFSDDYEIVLQCYWVCTDEDPTKRPNASEFQESLENVEEPTDEDIADLCTAARTKLEF